MVKSKFLYLRYHHWRPSLERLWSCTLASSCMAGQSDAGMAVCPTSRADKRSWSSGLRSSFSAFLPPTVEPDSPRTLTFLLSQSFYIGISLSKNTTLIMNVRNVITSKLVYLSDDWFWFYEFIIYWGIWCLLSIRSVVSNLFRAIPPLEVSPPAHSFRGQWLPVGGREALNSKKASKNSLMPSSSHAPLRWPHSL